MEELQHRPQITAQRDWGVVPSREMLSDWKASGPNCLLWIHGKRQSPPSIYTFAQTDVFPHVAGAGKSVLCYVNHLIFFILRFLRCRLVLLLTRTSKLRANMGLHHSRYFIATSGRNKRRISAGSSHPCYSRFPINPTPTMISFLFSIRPTAMVLRVPVTTNSSVV